MTYHVMEGYKELTWKEAKKAVELNAKNGWGFTRAMLRGLGTAHRKAFECGDILRQEAIEFRLMDANFHAESGLLRLHDYKTYSELVREV